MWETPQEYADWFEGWAGAFGAAMNTRRDLTIHQYKDAEDKAYLEEVLRIICARNPEYAYIGERYEEWAKTH